MRIIIPWDARAKGRAFDMTPQLYCVAVCVSTDAREASCCRIACTTDGCAGITRRRRTDRADAGAARSRAIVLFGDDVAALGGWNGHVASEWTSIARAVTGLREAGVRRGHIAADHFILAGM
jgi:hypothetical protein